MFLGFVTFCGIQTILEKLGLTFSWKFESCFIEIQYPVESVLKTDKQTNKDLEALCLAKNRDSERAWYKSRDCEMHITGEK